MPSIDGTYVEEEKLIMLSSQHFGSTFCASSSVLSGLEPMDLTRLEVVEMVENLHLLAFTCVNLRFTCALQALYLRFTCALLTIYLRFSCGLLTVYLRFTCYSFTVDLRFTGGLFTFYLRFICGLLALYLQFT